MSDIRLRPRSVTELVDAAFTLYRRDAVPYILAGAVASVPYLVLQLMIAGETTPDLSVLTALSGVLLGFAWFVSYTLVTAVVVKMGAEAYLGDAPDLAGALRAVLPRLPTLLGAAILRFLLLYLGALFLLVGALYVAARYFAVSTVIVLEGTSTTGAFRRSTVLSQGRKWHVLNTLGLIGIIVILLSVGVAIMGEMTGSLVLTIVINGAFGIVVYPLSGLVEMMLYYDTRMRSEGFDLELMAKSLDAAVPAPGAGPPAG